MGSNDYPKLNGHIYYGPEANHSIYSRKGATTTYGTISVGNTATQISAANTGRVTLLVYNNGSQAIYLGTSGVTTGTGYKLDIGESKSIEEIEVIYGIVASSTCNLRYIEVTK